MYKQKHLECNLAAYWFIKIKSFSLLYGLYFLSYSLLSSFHYQSGNSGCGASLIFRQKLDGYVPYCYASIETLGICGMSDHSCNFQCLVQGKDLWCIFFTWSLVETNVPIFISLLPFLIWYHIYIISILILLYLVVVLDDVLCYGDLLCLFLPSFSAYSHDIICISKIPVAAISTPNFPRDKHPLFL